MIRWNNDEDPFRDQRQSMVRWQLENRGISDPRVLSAMRRVPRHLFVDPDYRDRAYDDHPLPIGLDQTISQPYIVALMLELLELQPSDTVLEVGTGSGYTAAVLSELVAHVFSIERHAALTARAQSVLVALRAENVHCLSGDGSLGLPDAAPFNAILVWAASPAVPPALTAQLHEGGRLVIPIGPRGEQDLQLLTKIQGEISVQIREACRFVPLVTSHDPDFTRD